uniref:Ubiquitin-like domain-containing protein n=2 Tax=Auxenochlorella protothecoides TaxID=3075 RepID=A0A1D2AH89_AUXPR
MAVTTRGLGVGPSDLDAPRLVFVTLKDAPHRRRVAIPLPENAAWDKFTASVAAKLKLGAVDGVFLASTGEVITRLDQLQDIDDLAVTEAPAQLATSTSGVAPAAVQRTSSTPFRGLGGGSEPAVSPLQVEPAVHDEDGDSKYQKRHSALQRTLQPLFPGLFSSSNGRLPVTTKDISSNGAVTSPGPSVDLARKRPRRRSRRWVDPRSALMAFALLCCLGTMVFVYLHTVGLRGSLP